VLPLRSALCAAAASARQLLLQRTQGAIAEQQREADPAAVFLWLTMEGGGELAWLAL
jgi:hypothetical protein